MSISVVTESSPRPSRSRRHIYHPLPQHLAAGVTQLRGVAYSDGQARFDGLLYTEETAGIAIEQARNHRLAVRFQGQGKPATVTQEDVRCINEMHASVAYEAADLVVFERFSANDVLMRSPLKFTRRALDKFASDFTQGRGLHLNHEGNRGFGRVFAARVESATVRGVEANWLVTRSYAVTRDATPERLQLIADVQSGVLGYDSITFMGGDWNFQEVERGDDGTLYFFEVDDNDGDRPRLEAIELSVLSVLGNVYGAGDNRVENTLQAPTDAPSPHQPETPKEVILCM